MTLTIRRLRSLLKRRFKGVLTTGKHCEDGQACVRELRACALGLPWSDIPDGGSATDKACQALNDALWSSDAVRTAECLPLALLTESEAAPNWVKKYAERTIREIVPLALEAAAKLCLDHADALIEAAQRCRNEGTEAAACAAAWAAWAAGAAAWAAGAAAWAAGDAAVDEVLKAAVRILIESHKG